MRVIRSVELFFQEGTSDKLYNAQLVEDGDAWTVKVAWGRRGAKLSEGSKAVRVPLAVATAKLEALVREKLGKGYEEVAAGNAPAEVAPPEGQGSGSRVTGARARLGQVAQLLNPIEDDELERFLADDAMIAQQKIDGMRVLAHVGDDGILATNREGQKSKVDPRLLSGVARLPPGTVVDGEVLDDGYWLFDVLQVGDADVRAEGYVQRWRRLCGLAGALGTGARVVPIANDEAAKRELCAKLLRDGAEGVVFKHRDAPYTAGRPASGGAQRKHKFVKTADVVVLENAGNAYVMAVWDGDAVFTCGKVFAGTTNESRKALDAALGRGEQPVCEVRYLYATDDHQLFQPVFVRIRDDKPAGACIRAQLRGTSRAVLG